MSNLSLSLIISENERVRPLIEGKVKPEAIELTATRGNPADIFWRQLSFAEFDVSEMSMSSYLKLIDQGNTNWVGIPVFPSTRHFFHTWFLVRKDAGIEKPSDLREKRIGIPEYQITSTLWSRGIFQDEFGIKPEDIVWYGERTKELSHGKATGLELPPGIRYHQLTADQSMATMLLNGELDGIAIFFKQNTIVDRSGDIDLFQHPNVKTLFPDPVAEGIRYFQKTKIQPINHCVVVRRSIAERYPWVVINLYQAFQRSKEYNYNLYRSKLETHYRVGNLSRESFTALQKDPLQYGIKANQHTLETLARYSHEQGLTSRLIGLDEIFAPNTLHL